MNRTEPERRANRRRKIARRKRLLNSIHKNWIDFSTSFCEAAEIKDGYLDNNNEMNKYGQRGRAPKTKTKNSHASYRHSGAYGPAVKRTVHDQRQVDDMNAQELEEVELWNV